MRQESEPKPRRLYMFRRTRHGGKGSLLVGFSHWAEDADRAMRFLRLTFGHTAKQGWYAQDVTDDPKMRELA